MKITNLTAQLRNPDRVNVSIDGKYRLSLTLKQVIDLSVKIGNELDEEELARLESASTFGKLYQRTLEYSLVRPRSVREIRDYLYRKTRDTAVRNKRTGEISLRKGIDKEVTDDVIQELIAKGHVDDKRFAGYWVEHRSVKKGISARKLRAELQAKGVESTIIDEVLHASARRDDDELAKIIAKKSARYPDQNKLMQYLARQGFRYDDIKAALERDQSD